MTVVQVGIGDDGKLTGAAVTQSCGVPELDAEATRSVHAAAPFAAPPSSMTPLMFDARFTFGLDQPSKLQIVPY